MTTHNSQTNQLIVTIPGKDIKDLYTYRSSILGLLARVEIENCSPEIKVELKAIYELLLHLHTKEEMEVQETELPYNSDVQLNKVVL